MASLPYVLTFDEDTSTVSLLLSSDPAIGGDVKETISNITSKGRLTVPIEIRRHLGITTSGKVAFVVADNGRVEMRLARFTVEVLRGIVPPLPGRETIDFEDQIREAFEEKADLELNRSRSAKLDRAGARKG